MSPAPGRSAWAEVVARHRDIPAQTRFIGLLLSTEIYQATGRLTVNAKTIARRADCQPGKVLDAVRELERMGLLTDTRTTDIRGRWVFRVRIPELAQAA